MLTAAGAPRKPRNRRSARFGRGAPHGRRREREDGHTAPLAPAASRPRTHDAATPLRGTKPPESGPALAPQWWMNCIAVPASSMTSPLRSGTESPISGTPLTLGRLLPSTCAKA